MTFQIAYTVDQAAHALGRDRKFMDRQIKANRIAVKYADSRPMIRHEELMRFLDSLPDEKQAA